MNVDNRRLREIQVEKMAYKKLLENADKISDCLIYHGKLECLDKEEKDILRRYDVVA